MPSSPMRVGQPRTWSTTMARGMPRAIVPIGGGYGSTTTVQV
jgi:hypothetical protein